MSELTMNDALESLRQKFTSGNDVPVTEARITLAEYEALILGTEQVGLIGFVTSAGLLYRKYENDAVRHKVISVLIVRQEGDDDYDMKAIAERQVNKDLAEEVKGMDLVAWHFAWSESITYPLKAKRSQL